MPDPQQMRRFEQGKGFVAALDQSGGSSPKALRDYGIDESGYSSEAEMFDLIHQARARIVTSPAFNGDRVLGAILFEGTLDRPIDGKDPAVYLWEVKGIVPFLKIDKGLEAEQSGVQLMKAIPGLDDLLVRARNQGVFGTKERSVIHAADPEGIASVVAQQFELGERVLAADLMPILEPEVDVNTPDKASAEELLKSELLAKLSSLGSAKVGIKVTIPTVDGFYDDLISHPNVARVVALSGGYSRDDANDRLRRNPGLIASFSRALLDGLTAHQSDNEFNETLNASIESIYQASIA
ncbi:fructose bisphosphate aldolase [Mycobacterium sp. 141]|uniref:fructose bisphosphate aldolase n=1 Tax=Mycobacterium sp. 141 TaxID=1120797 RepID=UPI0003622CE8|nr:fructose bisphosphate aldolase [Mycobacterium sp. 141]